MLRRKGARGPLKALHLRKDRDEIVADLIAYHQQQATGRLPSEGRITLEGLARKYKTAPSTLQGYHQYIEEVLQNVRQASEACGVSQLDVISGNKRLWNETLELLERAKKAGEFRDIAYVLVTIMPVALDRLQFLVPKNESAELTGGIRKQIEGGERGLSVNFFNAIAGAASKPQEPVTIQRELEQ